MRFWCQVAFALMLLVSAHFMTAIAERAGLLVSTVQMSFAVLFAGTFCLLYGWSGQSRPPLGVLSIRRLALAVATGFALLVVGIVAYAGTSAVYSRMGWETPETVSFFNVAGIWDVVALFSFIAAAVPLEEFVFRGALLHKLTSRLSVTGAILVSSICFSIYHLSGFQLAATFLWGIGLGIVFVRTNSLLMPIIAHLTINVASVGLFLSGSIPKG